jgi:hypothetical protein
VQAGKVNKSQFRRRLRDFFAPVWNCHLSPFTFQITTKFAAKASLSLRIFRAGLWQPVYLRVTRLIFFGGELYRLSARDRGNSNPHYMISIAGLFRCAIW